MRLKSEMFKSTGINLFGITHVKLDLIPLHENLSNEHDLYNVPKGPWSHNLKISQNISKDLRTNFLPFHFTVHLPQSPPSKLHKRLLFSTSQFPLPSKAFLEQQSPPS